MREQALGYQELTAGLAGGPVLRFYASAETHFSVDKAEGVAGIGPDNLLKVATDASHSMRPEALGEAIATDRAKGVQLAGVILCAGGTSIEAFARIAECIDAAHAANLPCHVDAAWAGSAMICP